MHNFNANTFFFIKGSWIFKVYREQRQVQDGSNCTVRPQTATKNSDALQNAAK